MTDHRIVIAGAGYAGVSCALRLARRVPPDTRITLVSATDRFIERIRLHQRATGQNVGDWSLPALIRGTGVQLRVGAGRAGSTTARRALSVGDDRIDFDTLVLALGSHVDVDSVKGVREHAMAVEFGSVVRHPPRLAEGRGAQRTRHHRRRRSHRHRAGLGNRRVLPGSAGHAREPDPARGDVVRGGARSCARRRCAGSVSASRKVRTSERSTNSHLETDRGDLPFDLCIWAGGFVGHPLAWNSGLKVNQQGQALVDSQLRSVSHPAVHVIGDLGTVAPELTPQMPMGCKSAMPAGAWAAENIARRLRGLPEQPLQYGVPFFCVSLGRRDGLIQMAAARRLDDRPRADRTGAARGSRSSSAAARSGRSRWSASASPASSGCKGRAEGRIAGVFQPLSARPTYEF